MYIEAADLLLHGVGVDLAHVAAPVGIPQLSDVESPNAVVRVMGHGDPRVMSHHSRVKTQNCLVLRPNPAHLKQ